MEPRVIALLSAGYVATPAISSSDLTQQFAGALAMLARKDRAPSGGSAAPGAAEDAGADRLDELDLSAVSEYDLVDLAAEWQRIVCWAQARLAEVAGALGVRRGWSREHTEAGAEISAKLRLPQGEGNRIMARGEGLRRYAVVDEALSTGLIDVGKADILLTSGATLTPEQRAEAIDDFLPEAPDRSRRWLSDRMNERAREFQSAAEQARSERAKRAVYLDPVEGGTTAWISARLPATDAVAVWESVDSAARALKRTGSYEGTLPNARADVFTAIVTGRIVVPTEAVCAPKAESDGPGTDAAGTDAAVAGAATGV